MQTIPKKILTLRIVESVYSALLLVTFLLSLFLPSLSYINLPLLPFNLFSGEAAHPLLFAITCFFVYLIPCISLFKLVSWVLGTKIPLFASPEGIGAILLGLFQSAFVIISYILYTFTYARSASFFSEASVVCLLIFSTTIVFNAFSMIHLFKVWNRMDQAYREYVQYRTAIRKGSKNFEILFHPGIQRRLFFTFMPLIALIIIVLSLILMHNFYTTIEESVINNGKALAERTANVIKANPADTIATEDYLLIESKKNKKAATPFMDISYYARKPKGSSFSIAASTDKRLYGAWEKSGMASFDEPVYDHNEEKETYEFKASVKLGKAFLGYVQVNYDEHVVFEPYFRTKVKVLSIAAIFIYLSIFFIYAIGRNIVLPILLLRVSVSSISKNLSAMIQGKMKVSSELLQYHDRVQTHDEIKGLSSEVGNMTTVIRGIVPYISASTLKASERSSPMSESRDLCFLFTDIRGFTTLCEGMEPAQVVEMLNHYLDLQATIIMANHGEIDKFVGDEVMAMFEGKDKELNASMASLAIRTAMAKEKEMAIAEKKSVVSIGIGINSGLVVFGSVGAKHRMDFTSIGDTVNLAARLEGANKAYGTKSLVSEVVYDKIKTAYLCREIDMITVKGKSKPVRIYEILQTHEKSDLQLIRFARVFDESLVSYRAQDWDKAAKGFTDLSETMDDEASRTFLHRIELFRKNPPPPDWDGVFKMAVK